MDQLRSFLESVSRIAEDQPEAKGAALLGLTALAGWRVLASMFSRLRKKHPIDDRVKVNVDAPLGQRVQIKVGRKEEGGQL